MKLIQSRGTTLSSEIYKLIKYVREKNCLCSARSLLFYRLKMFNVVFFLYVTACLSQGLYTFVATAISKHVVIKVYKSST